MEDVQWYLVEEDGVVSFRRPCLLRLVGIHRNRVKDISIISDLNRWQESVYIE